MRGWSVIIGVLVWCCTAVLVPGWLVPSWLSECQALRAESPATVVEEITTAQRLALQQIDQLIAEGEGEAKAVVDLLVQTLDESAGRMIAVTPNGENADALVRYVPLTMFLNDRLLRWGVSHPAVLREYRQRVDATAGRRIEAASAANDLTLARSLADRFLATSHGDDALLAVADLALRRGYYWTAIAALRRLDPRWQAVAEPAPAVAEQKLAAAEVAGLGWEFILAGLDAAQFAQLRTYLLTAEQPRAAWPLGCYVGSELPPAAIGLRLVIAYRAAGERVTATRLAELLDGWYADAEVMFAGRSMPLAEALRAIDSAPQRVAERVEGTQWSTLGQDGQRVYQAGALGELPLLPSWRVELDVVETVSRTLPTEPPVGAATTTADRLRDQRPAADIWPIIHHGLIIGQAGDEIYAWQLKSGQPWPTGERGVPLFASPRGAALRPVAGELPADRRPQYSLSAARGRVAVRLGPPESGWLTVARPTQALSQLAVLDLQLEGRLLDGYPAQWSVPQRQAFYEFEGAPLIVGERMYVGVNQRDQANERSSVACFDVASGALLFQSPTLGSARPLVETSSHRLGHAVVSYREGTVYYQGDGGVVAAIDGVDGSLRWLLRYPRSELADSGYPRRRRAAVKRSSPIAIAGPLAIVMASDLDRLVGLDAATGCVVWASEPGQADDVDQILGRQDQWLIAGGDALSWIDRQTGVVVGQWPAGSSRQPHGALPQPRRAGRGLMAGDKIYWPTNDAIWIFAAKPARVASQSGIGMIVPRPLRRIELAASGLRGGDLITADGVLVMSQGSTIAAFKSLD